MRPVEAVIFDYGGVISSPLFRGIDRFEVDMGYPAGSILELVFGERSYVGVEGRAFDDAGPVADHGDAVTHDWHLLEIGAIGVGEYFESITRRAPEVLGRELDVDAFAQFQQQMEIGVHWPVVHEIRSLAEAGLSLALLTNNVKEWGDHWRATFPVDELFPVVVDSSEVGMRKPDPRIYQLTCERIGRDPEAAVFVDDNRQNCAAARALGIEAVQFEEDPWAAIEELRSILTRRGTKLRG